LYNERKGGKSYQAAQDLPLHFGLGARSRVEMSEVLWPRRALTKRSNPKSNQIVTIKEGEGLVDRRFPRVRFRPARSEAGMEPRTCVVGQLRLTSIEDPTACQSKAPEYRFHKMS